VLNDAEIMRMANANELFFWPGDPRPSEDQEDQDSSWKLQIANATANWQLATCRTMEVGLNGSQSVRSVAIVGSRVFNYRP